MWLLFPAGKAARAMQGMWSQPYCTGKQLEQSSREWRQGSTQGLRQCPGRCLGQGWAGTGRWMPRRAAAKCVGWSKGRSSCRESLGRKDRTDQPWSRKKSWEGEQEAGGNWGEMGDPRKGRNMRGFRRHWAYCH